MFFKASLSWFFSYKPSKTVVLSFLFACDDFLPQIHHHSHDQVEHRYDDAALLGRNLD